MYQKGKNKYATIESSFFNLKHKFVPFKNKAKEPPLNLTIKLILIIMMYYVTSKVSEIYAPLSSLLTLTFISQI
jgi:hypothetical protein